MAKVLFKHPQRGDMLEVDDTPEEMTPVMVQGYVQVTTPAPRHVTRANDELEKG